MARGASLPGVLSAFLEARLAARSGPVSLCVALSGGRDSVVLLHALHQLSAGRDQTISLSALHINHAISPHADDWAHFCSGLCADYGIPLTIEAVQVPRDSGEGLEGAARRVRYAAFGQCRADWLALAHHRNDQAETVLLNLLRGAGVAGVAGMPPERATTDGPALIRPFLDIPRSAIETYATQHQLRWIEDESNCDTHFRRNYLRHSLIPSLEQVFPGAQAALARSAGHFAEATALLDDLAAIDRASVAGPSGRIRIGAFNTLRPARARNLLRFVWAEAGFRAPDARWVEEALRQLRTVASQSEVCMATQDGELHVYRDEMHLVRHCSAPHSATLQWNGEPELQWAGGRISFTPVTGAGIRRSVLVDTSVSIRPRLGGERLQPDRRRPRRSLRNLLQEAAIPPWERCRLPFLWSNERLVWVGGFGVDAEFSCAPGEAGLLPVWAPGPGAFLLKPD